MMLYTKMCLDKNKVLTISEEINHIAWPTTQTCEEREGGKMLAKLSVSHTQGQKVRYSFDR